MMVLVAYDINVETPAGQRRLRHVAQACENVGQRVQNSLFECLLTPAQWVETRGKLLATINKQTDSLRFYFLGKNYSRRIEHVGAKPTYDPQEPLII